MDQIQELLTRGVDSVVPSQESLEEVLKNGKKLTLYQGFDPTGTQLHIGHMVGFRKLRQWQDLGHKVIFLIGDGTGQAGDPSGKKTGREKFFTREELRTNAVDYVKQASKIVRFDGENPVEIRFNGDWLNKLQLVDILEIAGHFTLQQLAERDMFQERMKKGEPVNLREFLYPLLQGYDSVAMNVDLEIGGSDQLFNMLCGRTLLKAMKNKEKFIMTTPLLEDSQGRKIGKTEGNVIGLTDQPEDLFGKIMALGDDIIIKGFTYLTDISIDKINEINKKLEQGDNPVQYKKQFAFEIVKQLHSTKAAEEAQIHFEKTVQNRELPTIIEEKTVSNTSYIVTDLLVLLSLAASKADAKRLFQQGGVEINNERVTDPNMNLQLSPDTIIKVGKRKIVKVTVS